jgi:hypothetical protein
MMAESCKVPLAVCGTSVIDRIKSSRTTPIKCLLSSGHKVFMTPGHFPPSPMDSAISFIALFAALSISIVVCGRADPSSTSDTPSSPPSSRTRGRLGSPIVVVFATRRTEKYSSQFGTYCNRSIARWESLLMAVLSFLRADKVKLSPDPPIQACRFPCGRCVTLRLQHQLNQAVSSALDVVVGPTDSSVSFNTLSSSPAPWTTPRSGSLSRFQHELPNKHLRKAFYPSWYVLQWLYHP